MHNPLWAPIAVIASRELALSALPDAPVVAHERRRESRRLRRGTWRLRRRTALRFRPFADYREAV
jgi:hypothetical protein